ncbi:hypothetical protein [Chitinimonas sp. BJYL2]|uniref:hypothetical protein n=1 Tax=Chitinimonas sp. BJYL2 TaxID=2976696 RepID=UPI0022B48774|nr:hypothetical protein [Chitinimonas sp. BJYL2]
MLEYEKVFEFTRPEFVAELHAFLSQEQGQLNVSLVVEKADGRATIELSGFDGLANAVSILIESEKVLISKETNSGKEFGSIRIECWVDECYSEHWCDSAAKT